MQAIRLIAIWYFVGWYEVQPKVLELTMRIRKSAQVLLVGPLKELPPVLRFSFGVVIFNGEKPVGERSEFSPRISILVSTDAATTAVSLGGTPRAEVYCRTRSNTRNF